MNNLLKVALLSASMAILADPAALYAQSKKTPAKKPVSTAQVMKENFSPDAVIPNDPKVRIGTLKNGMKYYIRQNAHPEKRVELRLAVNVGSMMEEDDQQGLAHFLEHMAFNGTKNFKKNELVDYLESIGTRFGADLNAYTSFDETVYMLQLPTDKPGFVDKGLLVLEDWAHNVSLDNEEIDKERGVVIEEWRLGRGADDRMFQKTAPVMLYNSRYAQRLPIGKKEILEKFSYERVKQFYKDWYRPDLMAVMVVGDVDPIKMEAQIQKQFGAIPAAANPKKREIYGIPDHADTKVAVVTDKEAQYTMIQMMYKHDKLPQGRYKDYRQSLIHQLFNGMIGGRLDELRQQANPPFVYAGSSISPFMREKASFGTFAIVQEGGVERGIETILQENQKVRKFGFTQTELDRQKKAILRQYESMLKDKDKTESKDYIGEYVRNFLTSETMPGIAHENEIASAYLPTITLAEVNALVSEWIKAGNNSIIVTGPEKEGVKMPTEEQLLALLKKGSETEVTAYKDVATDKPLIAQKPQPGKIVSEKQIKEIGVTEWTLSNGAKVVLKPTSFKEDEVLFQAFSPGGTSLIEDRVCVSADNCAQIVNYSGLGEFDAVTLQKMLTGKIANVSPYISELEEGLDGEASPDDLETMFQMAHLYIKSPRKDQNGYEAYKTQVAAFVQNNSLSPQGVFRDTFTKVMSQGHIRRRPYTTEVLNEMNLDAAYNIYQQRFGNAGDFTYIIVGNFQPEKVRAYVETYLASLPAGPKETWKDLNVNPPKGVVKRTVKKGVEPKSQVMLSFTGPFAWNGKNRLEIDAMMKTLNIMLREQMREEKGGVYGVGAYAQPAKFPKETYTINITFGCSPDNVDMLVKTVFEQIELLKKEGASDKNLQKVKETMKRTRETSIKENKFWASRLKQAYWTGENPTDINAFDAAVDALNGDGLKKAANQYLNTSNYAQVILMPEK